jgi:hypothetical protein
MPKTKNPIPDPRQQLVENGDFLQLLNQMLDRSSALACPDNDLKRMARAIRNKAVADPSKLTEDALTSAISFASYLLCRVQYTVFRKIQEHDQRHQSMPPALPPDVAQEWLPRAERLVRLIMDLAKTQATIQAKREKHDEEKTGKPTEPISVGGDTPKTAEPQILPGKERIRTTEATVPLHEPPSPSWRAERPCGSLHRRSLTQA